MAEWQERGKLIAGDKRLEYACFGPAPHEAPTLVLLHEGLGCVELWRDFPQRLTEATGCGVFVFSRAGYGQSELCDLPRPLDYMSREAIVVLPQVLDAIGLKRGVLVGHSDGASIAAIHMGTVIDHRIRGGVLIAPHFFTEPMGLKEINRAKELFQTTDMRPKMAKYHRDAEHTFRGWNDAWLHPDFEAWDISDSIDHWRVPVLVIQGRDDPYGTLAQVDEASIRAYSPVETLILDACGHSPFLDQKDATVSEVATFLERLLAIEGFPTRV